MNRMIFGRPLRSFAFDVAVCGFVMFFAVVVGAAQPGGWPAHLLGAAMAVVLLFRRAHPLAVAAVVAAVALAQVIAGWGPMPYDVAVLIAMYSVVKYAERLRDGILAGLATVAGIPLAVGQMQVANRWGSVIYLALVTGAVWLAALNVRTRRLYVLSLEERAVTLERERDAQARAAVAEERGRIARELHDIVAHSMAVMIVQADGARYLMERDPDTARAAVKTVADTGRQALTEMRRLVGVLRDAEQRTPALEPDSGRRHPALADLDALVDRSRAAGVVVRHTVHGEPSVLPPGLDLTVYRMIQEALTNTLKHAGVGANVDITVDYRDPGAVVVRVVDDGGRHRGGGPAQAALRQSGGPPGGHGLVGMRERAAVYGGSLTAGPEPGGGWRVEARLPLPSAVPAAEVVAA